MRPGSAPADGGAVRRPDAGGMSSRLSLAAAVLAALALGLPAGAQAADCAGADLVPAAANLPQVGHATLCLLNQQRAAAGAQPLRESPQLTFASAGYSRQMVAQAFFAHEAPDGSTLVERLTTTGYIQAGNAWSVGENIGWGQSQLSTPRAMVAAWMNSPGHRANILDRGFEEIGLGVALGTPPDRTWGATYTTDFGKRAHDVAVAAGPRAVTRKSKRAGARRAPARCARVARAAARAKHGRRATAARRAARKACTARAASRSHR
jgi:uncharacterized protein YkwD